MQKNYQRTIFACFLGYIVQAVVNNYVPLLFLTFQKDFAIPLSQISALIAINFGVQLVVDLLSAAFVDRIGYRASIILAQVFAATGLASLAFLPYMLPNAFAGILISVVLYAIGGGMIEVLISPIMESCPTDNKEKAMSLLHSFYCWGQVGVVLVSTVFFRVFGIGNWRVLACLWALLPLVDLAIFVTAPIAPLVREDEQGIPFVQLIREKAFWVFMLMMVCAGASELSVSQWASAFAEKGLGVSKTVGDLMGPMFFAVLMGSARAFYGKYGDKLNLDRFMWWSAVLCVVSYLMISLSPWPMVSLLGCGLCGLSVGIMWPGSFSKASAMLRRGGTALFALLALAGDLGCGGGPALVGMVSGALGDDLKGGILVAIVFPLLLLAALRMCRALGRGKQAETLSNGK